MSVDRFDAAAASWDAKPRRVQLAETVAEAICSTLPLGQDMTGLEYGCGTGLVTFELAKSLGCMYGLDRSAGMIDVLQEKKAAQGASNVRPLLGDWLECSLPPLDLIVICMTLHHIDTHLELLGQCYERLRDGGFLAVADLEPEDGSFHQDHTGIFHFGFEPERLCQDIQNRGFTQTAQKTIHQISRDGHDYPIFLLTAQKA